MAMPDLNISKLGDVASDGPGLRKAVMTVRLVIGGLGLLTPRLFARLFGLDVTKGSAISPLMRLFAVREALMAYQLYQAPDEELEEVLRQGILVDGIDLATALAAFGRGDIGVRTFLMTASAASAVGAAGYLARPDK